MGVNRVIEDTLILAECSIIYEKTPSGKTAGRLELDQCRKALRPGDILVVWRLEKLGRSLSDLVQIVTELAGKTDNGFNA